MKFALPLLDYAYDALVPYIDARTMEVHHLKHHAGYINKLNDALADYPERGEDTLEDILKDVHTFAAIVRNTAGGAWNHNLFFKIIGPPQEEKTTPSGTLFLAIQQQYGSFEKFQQLFQQAAMRVFGSGWAWLVVKHDGHLAIGTTANQDNPLMPGVGLSGTPILALDVWEHAYYLNYQNRRGAYATAFWQLVQWDEVEARYTATLTNNVTAS